MSVNPTRPTASREVCRGWISAILPLPTAPLSQSNGFSRPEDAIRHDLAAAQPVRRRGTTSIANRFPTTIFAPTGRHLLLWNWRRHSVAATAGHRQPDPARPPTPSCPPGGGADPGAVHSPQSRLRARFRLDFAEAYKRATVRSEQSRLRAISPYVRPSTPAPRRTTRSLSGSA